MLKCPRCLLIPLVILPFIRGNAVAHPGAYGDSSPRVDVEFLVAGRPLPQQETYTGERFIPVPRWGVEYEIRVTNYERRDRVLFVVGVDGLSVVDGRTASQRSGGYVLEPGDSLRIRGWRRGLDHVAAFTFTGREDSYAGKTGRRGNIGEVRVWAIREGGRPAPAVAEAPAGAEKKVGSSARSAGTDGDTGTGYGDELEDHVRATRFARSDSVTRLHFRYELRHMHEPRHDDGGEGSYVPPPPGWRR